MLKRYFILVLCLCFSVFPAFAEDWDANDDLEQNEALFNELFSDYDETDKDITEVKKFDDIIEKTAEMIKKSGATAPLSPELQAELKPEEEPELPPIEGELFIGIVKDSFSISKNMVGRPACTFSVMLRSEMNRKIKILGINLLYLYTTFAFTFTNVAEKSTQEHFIRTSGDICYHLNDLPDIEVNKCLIYAASRNECATRIKWDTGMISTDTSEKRADKLRLY